jgi:hypothetical protein
MKTIENQEFRGKKPEASSGDFRLLTSGFLLPDLFTPIVAYPRLELSFSASS